MLTISDIYLITNEINSLSGFDFSDYGISFIKHRTELFMKDENILSVEDLIFQLNKSEQTVLRLLKKIFVSQSELFRDTELWNYLYEKILPKLLLKREVRIHLPYCVNGEDLYSLIFFLGSFKSDMITIYVTHPLKENEKEIRNKSFNQKDIKACAKNIELLNLNLNPEDIFKGDINKLKINHMFTGKLIFENNIPEKILNVSEFDMVFFRNRLIYYNEALQKEVLNKISASLKKGGYLIIGEREALGHISGKFKKVHSDISIYKKRIF